ncbi:paramyosin-like [Anopheles cruzii]|uniref:paramyosin-like n=1 Tax=Anopheles cruzii TaxID=68878 RepID=UPI0022EC9579|nr:paramyosin-like [Anopheles cruzii]
MVCHLPQRISPSGGMDKYEENLLRLNHRIRDLIAQVDRLDTKNRKLHNENTVLVEDVARFRSQYALAEEARLQCKSVIEKELERSQQQFEAHQLLKRRYNDLIKEYVAQNHKLKASEANATVRHSRIKRNRVPVEIIGKISDIGKPTAFEERMTTLENRCSALEKELAKAYTIIDDLEFELETIDHLEDLNDQLERQVRDLKVELEKRKREVPFKVLSLSFASTASDADGRHEIDRYAHKMLNWHPLRGSDIAHKSDNFY